jgi:RNA polymerase sigma-70 factor (ECF subfamily)
MQGDSQETSDAQLVELTLQSQDFFAYIIDRYENKLSRYINKIAHLSHEDSQDLLQDIFTKVYINLNAYDSNLSFNSWIYRIAHNTTVSHWRKMKVRPEGNLINIEDDDLYRIASDITSDKSIIQKEQKRQISHALGNIDEKYRSILILFYLEEKDYNEISDILKIPPGTVATRLSRGKKAIKKSLESIGYE